MVTSLFLGFVWAAENRAPIRRFRRNHPSVCVLVILLASYLFMSVLGGLAVFLFGIAFPVLSKFFLCPLKEGAAGPGKNHSEKLNNKIS